MKEGWMQEKRHLPPVGDTASKHTGLEEPNTGLTVQDRHC